MYLSFSNTNHRPITPLLLYCQPCSIYWCIPSQIGHRPPGATCSTVPSVCPLQKHNAFLHIKPQTLCKLLLIIRIQSLPNIRVIALPVHHLPCSATAQTPNNQVLFVRNHILPDHAVLPRPLYQGHAQAPLRTSRHQIGGSEERSAKTIAAASNSHYSTQNLPSPPL